MINNNSFQTPPNQVSYNINPQAHNPHIDHSNQDNLDDWEGLDQPFMQSQ